VEDWQWIAIGRMLLCVLIGGAVGLEREYHGRAAGFRTHILVCLESMISLRRIIFSVTKVVTRQLSVNSWRWLVRADTVSSS